MYDGASEIETNHLEMLAQQKYRFDTATYCSSGEKSCQKHQSNLSAKFRACQEFINRPETSKIYCQICIHLMDVVWKKSSCVKL